MPPVMGGWLGRCVSGSIGVVVDGRFETALVEDAQDSRVVLPSRVEIAADSTFED